MFLVIQHLSSNIIKTNLEVCLHSQIHVHFGHLCLACALQPVELPFVNGQQLWLEWWGEKGRSPLWPCPLHPQCLCCLALLCKYSWQAGKAKVHSLGNQPCLGSLPADEHCRRILSVHLWLSQIWALHMYLAWRRVGFWWGGAEWLDAFQSHLWMLCILPCLPHWWHVEGEAHSAFPRRAFPGLTGLGAETHRDEGTWQDALQASGAGSAEAQSSTLMTISLVSHFCLTVLFLSFGFHYCSSPQIPG